MFPANRNDGDSVAKMPSLRTVATMDHKSPVLAVTWNSNGGYCLTGTQDRYIRLWNPHKDKLIQTYRGHGREVGSIAVSKDSSMFVSCGGDKLVFLWDVQNATTVRRFEGHFNRNNCVALNEEASVVGSASYDATVRLWDCRSNSKLPLQVLEEAKDSVSSVSFSQEMILTGSVDGYVREYDIRAGLLKADHIGVPIVSAVYSHDGNCVLAACLDSTLRLLDRETGKMLNEYKGHRNENYRMDAALNYTDANIVSGSEDSHVYIWDLVEARIAYVLKGHTKAVSAVSCHPKDHIVLSGSFDGALRVWSHKEDGDDNDEE